jgi:hypothetical protein
MIREIVLLAKCNMEYELYLQIFVVLATLHITMDLIRLIISLCEVTDMPANIDERLDIMEEHIIQLMEGEYMPNQRNTIICENVPSPTCDEKED